jgi:beta-lactam-binding protein with PASTA domain
MKSMAEPPPPRDPRDPADDETVVVPPSDQQVDETVVRDEWGAETVVSGPVEEEAVLVEETEPPARKPPTLWPWLLALLVLVVGGLLAYFLLSGDDDEPATTDAVTTQVEERTVPDVVGTTSSEATETLRDAGFDANVVSVPSDSPAGTVVAQDPAAGATEPEGTTVRLNVAREAEGTTTGDTTTTEPTTTGTTTTAPTTTAPTTTAPPPQPQPAVVPDAVGQELAEAARAFADEGLKASVAYVPSEEPAGRVVAQAQPAGTELERGDTVQVNVSRGPDAQPPTAVPGVVGDELESGRDQLEEAGFEVLALTVGDGQIRNESPIVSQSPSGGAPPGALVLVYV